MLIPQDCDGALDGDFRTQWREPCPGAWIQVWLSIQLQSHLLQSFWNFTKSTAFILPRKFLYTEVEKTTNIYFVDVKLFTGYIYCKNSGYFQRLSERVVHSSSSDIFPIISANVNVLLDHPLSNNLPILPTYKGPTQPVIYDEIQINLIKHHSN